MTHSISREDLAQRLASKDAPVLIEALPARYYDDGHIPGAINIPHDAIAQAAPAKLPDRTAAIVVYCASATCRNSHIAAQALERLGYENVAVYGGGKEDWSVAGLPLEKAAAPTAA